MTEYKYKTEKRKPRFGERILITNAILDDALYHDGEVYDVKQTVPEGVFTYNNLLIHDEEYEVIVGQHLQLPNLDEMDYDELVALSEAVMKAIRTRSYKLGYDQGRFDAEIEAAHGTYEKSDQQKRDEIVEQAKRDVEDLTIRHFVAKHDFIVNAGKRTVVALRRSWIDGRILRRGIAKCTPVDCFNVHIGKAIVLRRALGLEVPAEYLNVPQPTEVRVGDVIRGVYKGEKNTYERKIAKIEGGRYTYDSGGFDYIEETDLEIIDDSRAGEGE
ncbi:hypothetical protein [Bacillus safensis]|uniref:hypothetical protein n=1 Tax=Bacillus safensis TaxID=561879 RepID=UPI0021E61B7B|nr:hypothetical protein [Bacillus safensis]UXO88814.1 hypothetical protein N7921_03675 [Bacillus safensis]